MYKHKILLILLVAIVFTSALEQQTAKHVKRMKRSHVAHPVFTTIFSKPDSSNSFSQTFFEYSRIRNNANINKRFFKQKEISSVPGQRVPVINENRNGIPAIITLQGSLPKTRILTPLRNYLSSSFSAASEHKGPYEISKHKVNEPPPSSAYTLPNLSVSASFVNHNLKGKETNDIQITNGKLSPKLDLPKTDVSGYFVKSKPKDTIELSNWALTQYQLPKCNASIAFGKHVISYPTQPYQILKQSLEIPVSKYIPQQVTTNVRPQITVTDHFVESPKSSYGTTTSINNQSPVFLQISKRNHSTAYSIAKPTFPDLPPHYVKIPFIPASQSIKSHLLKNQVPDHFIEPRPKKIYGLSQKYIDSGLLQYNAEVSIPIPLIPNYHLNRKHETYGVPKLEVPVHKLAKRSVIISKPDFNPEVNREHFNNVPEKYVVNITSGGRIYKVVLTYYEFPADDNNENNWIETQEWSDNDVFLSKTPLINETQIKQTELFTKSPENDDSDHIDDQETITEKHEPKLDTPSKKHDKLVEVLVPRKEYKIALDKPISPINLEPPTTKSSTQNANVDWFVNILLDNLSPAHSSSRRPIINDADVAKYYKQYPGYTDTNPETFQRREKRSVFSNPIFSSIFSNKNPEKSLSEKFLEGSQKADITSENNAFELWTNSGNQNHINHHSITEVYSPFDEYGVPINIDLNLKNNNQEIVKKVFYQLPKIENSRPFREGPRIRPVETYGVPFQFNSIPHKTVPVSKLDWFEQLKKLRLPGGKKLKSFDEKVQISRPVITISDISIKDETYKTPQGIFNTPKALQHKEFKTLSNIKFSADFAKPDFSFFDHEKDSKPPLEYFKSNKVQASKLNFKNNPPTPYYVSNSFEENMLLNSLSNNIPAGQATSYSYYVGHIQDKKPKTASPRGSLPKSYSSNTFQQFQISHNFTTSQPKHSPLTQEEKLPKPNYSKPFQTFKFLHNVLSLSNATASNSFHEVTNEKPNVTQSAIKYNVPKGVSIPSFKLPSSDTPDQAFTFSFHVGQGQNKNKQEEKKINTNYKFPENEKTVLLQSNVSQNENSRLFIPKLNIYREFQQNRLLTVPSIALPKLFKLYDNPIKTSVLQTSNMLTLPILKDTEKFQNISSKPDLAAQTPFRNIQKPQFPDVNNLKIIKPKKQDIVETIPLSRKSKFHLLELHIPNISNQSSASVGEAVINKDQIIKTSKNPVMTESVQGYISPNNPHRHFFKAPTLKRIEKPVLSNQNMDTTFNHPTKYTQVVFQNVLPKTLQENIDFNAKFTRNYFNIAPNLDNNQNILNQNEVPVHKNNVTTFLRNEVLHHNKNEENLKVRGDTNATLSNVRADLLLPRLFKKELFLNVPISQKIKNTTVGRKTLIINNTLPNIPIKTIVASFLNNRNIYVKTANESSNNVATKNADILKRTQVLNRGNFVPKSNNSEIFSNLYSKKVIADFLKNRTGYSGLLRKPNVVSEVKFAGSNRSDITVGPVSDEIQESYVLGNRSQTVRKFILNGKVVPSSTVHKNQTLRIKTNITNTFIVRNNTAILKSRKFQQDSANNKSATNYPVNVGSLNNTLEDNSILHNPLIDDSGNGKVLLKVVKRPIYRRKNIVASWLDKERESKRSDETVVYERKNS